MVDQTLPIDANTETVGTPTQGKITFEEFLRLYDGRHAEWIDGAVIEIMGTTFTHNEVLHFLFSLLRNFILQTGAGRVLSAPFVVRIPGRERGREPDICVIGTAQLGSLYPAHFDGTPLVIIEIISDESEDRDRIEKYLEYQAAGVDEYWLIDPRFQQVFFYHRGENGNFVRMPLTTEDEYESTTLPGFRLPVSLLWRAEQINAAQFASLVDAMIARLRKAGATTDG